MRLFNALYRHSGEVNLPSPHVLVLNQLQSMLSLLSRCFIEELAESHEVWIVSAYTMLYVRSAYIM